MHTAKLTRPGSAPMKALGHPERALAPLLLGNVRLGEHLLFGLKDEGENTQMFDLAPQAENAVVAEAGPSAGERALMRAVLEDAIRCLRGEAGPVHQRTRLAAEARSWIEAAIRAGPTPSRTCATASGSTPRTCAAGCCATRPRRRCPPRPRRCCPTRGSRAVAASGRAARCRRSATSRR